MSGANGEGTRTFRYEYDGPEDSPYDMNPFPRNNQVRFLKRPIRTSLACNVFICLITIFHLSDLVSSQGNDIRICDVIRDTISDTMYGTMEDVIQPYMVCHLQSLLYWSCG